MGGAALPFTTGTVTINGVTVDTTANTGNYKGYAYAKITYNDCAFVGNGYTTFDACSFNGCTFNINGYIWTWGAPELNFTECTFIGDSRTILAHGSKNTTINITDCDFAATTKGHTGAGELKLTQNGITMAKTGIGNTVGFTFQADFKASADGTVPPTQFKIDRYESTSAPTIFGFDAEGNVYVGDATKGTRVGKISGDKFTPVTVVYNADTGMIDGYVDGVYGGSYTITDNADTRKALLKAIDTDTHGRFQLTIYGGYLGSNWNNAGVSQEIIDSGALVFEETTEFTKLDGNSQIYVKSGDTYKWSKNEPKAGTQMYKVTSIDYEKYEAYFTQHESFYMDNASLTAGVHAPAAK